jgi:hypothetical protein
MLNGMCPVFSADMSDKEGCPYFTSELHLCDVCGNHISQNAIIDNTDDVCHVVCPQCGQGLDMCATCIQYKRCAFQQDTSCPEPPQIMKQMRQGNMVMQTQVLNPKRIEATCRKGCPCFDEDGLDSGNFCKKQNGVGCCNYKTRWRN